MLLLGLLFGLPIAFVVAWIVLLLRGPRAGLFIGLLSCCVTIAAGFWAISQSRASTAGIGILALPVFGSLAGALAWTFARFRVHSNKAARICAWLCLLASMGVAASFYRGGLQEQEKNRGRDRLQAENSRQIDENRRAIKRLIDENNGREADVLDAEIERHLGDRTFLIPALETAFVSEERLDGLSRHDDLNVVLMVARNLRARPDTLERIYRKSSYPPYFFQALAEHKNTPVDILRALSVDSKPLGSLDRSLARNPSVPRDILDEIANAGDRYALRNLLGNAALDCELLRKVKGKLDSDDRNNVQSSDATVASVEARLCRER